MRLYSHTQTRAQYAIKAAMLNAPYHIDRLRLGEAQKAKEQFKSFLNGRQDYLDSGVIEDEDLGKKYLVEFKQLTRSVTDKAKVVFCTPALCR